MNFHCLSPSLLIEVNKIADIVDKESSSKIMKNIKSITKLEDRVAKSLWNQGIRFRRNVKDLYGQTDISIKKYN
ncbi:hypothetical protein [Paenibacillus sp. FSL K6-2859]|jgi:DNA mismatch endonuclease (patch repair protein)|uniref:hypothetical protein n=1 Tax=Paenibacillus sp. FSL K6-2859 TaxID=2921482 RepID=UPI004046DB73